MYLRFAPEADNRRGREATAPINLANVVLKPTPSGDQRARRSPFFLAPTPGRVLVATLSDNIRGLFSEPGCRNGNLFIPAGSSMNEMTSSLSYTTIGALSGGDVVTMRADRSDLGALAFGSLYRWNGTSFDQVVDVDAPNPASTFAVVARRWIGAFASNDAFGWAVAGDYSDWPANNQAQDQDLPDPIIRQEEIGGELWSFNAKSTQPWQPTGGAEESAFMLVPGVKIKVGLAAPHAYAALGGGGMLVGHNRVIHGTNGYDLAPIPNAAAEAALKQLTPSEIESLTAWSYQDGSKEFWGLPIGDRAFVFDRETSLWHERNRYGQSTFDVDFACSAFGQVFVASRNSPKLWRLDDDVYVDEDDPILRDWTISIPSQGDVPVDRLVFDIVTRAVPVTGQGSAPKIMVRTSNDNGESWDTWRTLNLPTPSSRFRVEDWAFGLASNADGMLVQMRISDPLGFSFFGIWVNPSEEELNT